MRMPRPVWALRPAPVSRRPTHSLRPLVWLLAGSLLAGLHHGCRSSNSHALSMEQPGGTARLLTAEVVGVTPPQWSPDGRRLALLGYLKPQVAQTPVQAKPPNIAEFRRLLQLRQPGTPALPVTDPGIILINVTNGVSWMLPPSPQEGAAPDWVTWWPDGRLLVCHWTARDTKVGNFDDIILQTRLWLVDPDSGLWEEIGRIDGWGRAYGGPGGAYLWTGRTEGLHTHTYETLYLVYASDHGPRVRVQLNNSCDYGWSPQGDFVLARFWADPRYEDLILVSTADGQRHPIKLAAIAADGKRSTDPLAPEEMVAAKAQSYEFHYTRNLFAINMLTGHQRLISRLLPKIPYLSQIGSCLAGRWVLLWQADPEGERPPLAAMNVQDSRFYPVTQAGVFASRECGYWNSTRRSSEARAPLKKLLSLSLLLVPRRNPGSACPMTTSPTGWY